MWQNNGFANNGPFQNNFNSDDGSFPPFRNNRSPPIPGQQLFPQQPNMMLFDNQNGEGIITNEFQPEVGLFNNRAFLQNQFVNQDAQVCFVDPNISSRSVATQTPQSVTSGRVEGFKANWHLLVHFAECKYKSTSCANSSPLYDHARRKNCRVES